MKEFLRTYHLPLCVVVLCAIISNGRTIKGQYITGSEERAPAYLLRPRNFNPHPYQSASTVHHSQNFIYPYGQLSQYQPQYQYLVPYALPSSPERNPYNIIKTQRDYLSRAPSQEDQVAYNALSKHAQKVLQEPDLAKKYAFQYMANDIYHAQQQDDNGLVKGSYEVPLPDGRIQVVQYTADNNGYHPEISYKGEAAVAQPVVQYTTPTPVQRGSVVVYPDEEEVEVEPPRSYYSSTTTSNQPNAVQYNNYGLISGLPKPYGTVKTVRQQNPSQGQIQYATYEEVVDVDTPANTYYEK